MWIWSKFYRLSIESPPCSVLLRRELAWLFASRKYRPAAKNRIQWPSIFLLDPAIQIWNNYMNARNRKAKRVLYGATFSNQITKYFNFALMKPFSFQVVLFLNNQHQCSCHHQIMRTNVVSTVQLTWFCWRADSHGLELIISIFSLILTMYDATKYRFSGSWISPTSFFFSGVRN